MIYLDNAATTKPLDSVCQTINLMNSEFYGNTSSLHSFGFESEKMVSKTRNILADILAVKSESIYFTSGGTESNNIAILGYLKANAKRGKHVITTSIEHPSVSEVFKQLETQGYEVSLLNVDANGIIDYKQLEELIRPDTVLISIMMVNNETGAKQDFSKISSLRNRKNPKAVIHSDCVQAFGKFNIKPESIGIDMLSASGHKIYGPKGIGFLYIKKGVRVLPIMYGGGHEKALRSGTLNSSAIAALYHAVLYAKENMNANLEWVKGLKLLLWESLSSLKNAVHLGFSEFASPYILNVSFENVKSEVFLHHMAERGIYVSSGSACASNSKNKKHSHVLTAMGVNPKLIDGSVRFSFSTFNTREEIEEVAQVAIEIVQKIKYAE